MALTLKSLKRLLWLQGWTLLLLGPFIDRLVSGLWVLNYEFTVPALTILSISCGCAVFVNVSQFMCLGRFSAVSFQVGRHLLSRLQCLLCIP